MTQEIRAQLEALQIELEERIAGTTKALSQIHSPDSGEQAVERENDDVLQSLKAEGESELIQVKDALKRMDLGTYGTCKSCGQAIQQARLAAMPFASLCITCASANDQ